MKTVVNLVQTCTQFPTRTQHRNQTQIAPKSQSTQCNLPVGYPLPEEERQVAHEAFLRAYEGAQPETYRIPGLQEFAASIWDRRHHIPSQTFHDPLQRIYDEFDEDRDGHLNAKELAHALQSRSVEITEEQAQTFIDAADHTGNHLIEKDEFAELIHNMATMHRETKKAEIKKTQTEKADVKLKSQEFKEEQLQ